MMSKSVSIIIPNYNGAHLLRENLPLLQERTRHFGADVEIIVVENGSCDDSLAYLRSLSGIRIVEIARNCGFGPAVNAGVEASDKDIVYVLNNDVKVCPGFLEPLLAHFQRPDVFAVCSTEVDRCGDPAAGEVFPVLVKFKLGIFWYWYEKIARPRGAVASFCVSGGHSAYDRRTFLELGGFDPMLRPFYAEDGDVCWQAWKLGYASLIEPASQVVHAKSATIGRLYRRQWALSIHWKNRFLMTWKNLDSGWLMAKHALFTVFAAFICPCIGRSAYTWGLCKALGQIPEVIAARRRLSLRKHICRDRDLFRRFSRLPLCGPATVLYVHESAGIGGAENSLLQLVKGLDRSRFTPLFVLAEKGPFAEELSKLGIESCVLPMPAVRRISGVLPAMTALVMLCRQRQVRLLHSQSIRTHFYATIAARMVKAPVVWHQRNLLTREWVDPDRLFSGLADMIVCNSNAIARRFLRGARLPAHVRVVYSGVDMQQFSPAVSGLAVRRGFGIPEQAKVIGIASRFHVDKGHETFLAAARQVADALPGGEVYFLIAGGAVFKQDECRREQLQRRVDELGLAGRVIFTGVRSDMPQVYAAMDVVVLASQAEPFGRVVLEAMASAKPVVATASGGTPEMLQPGTSGLLFAPGDARSLADQLLMLLRDPGLAARLGTQARQQAAERFSIETHCAAMQDMYLRLLGDYYA